MTYSRYVGLIHDIMDSKMTMAEVDEYIKDNFEEKQSKNVRKQTFLDQKSAKNQ